MNRILLFFVICALSAGSLWAAENATFREIKGKVEYQLPGDDWMPAKVGVAIPAGATISTGFRSTAALELMGSIILVRPLTRMILDELVRTPKGTRTGLTLLSGKVRAEVHPSSTTSKTDFEVKSPTATASVLGTGFEFDGQNLLVEHGTVHFTNQYHVSRSVTGGEFSSTGKGAMPSPPVAVMAPEKPLLTADGGEDQVNAALGSGNGGDGSPLQSTDSHENLTQVIATYGNTIVINNGQKTPLQQIQSIVSSTLRQSRLETPTVATVNITVQ